MSRWGVRIAGFIFLFVLLAMLFAIQKQLEGIARARGLRPGTTTTTTSPSPP
jgi:hypothetical protein